MLIRRLDPVLLLCVLGLAGCASLTSEHAGMSPQEAPRGASDSVRTGSAPSETPPANAQDDGRMEALRAAYVDGAYEKVIRRARKRRRGGRDTTEVIPLNVLLGRAEQARGRHGAAIEALRRARVAASERGRSMVAIDRALGESYVALYRWSHAASAFRRVLDAQPRDRAARQALADVYRRSRQWKRARAQYARLVRADSSNGQWWARLAQCALQLNATGQAVRHFAEAHRRLPRAADVALTLSRLYRASDQLDAARRVVDTTLSHQSGDPRLWRRRADLAFERDRLDRARRAYTRTIAMGDSSATVYRRIGLIDLRRQHYARALSFLRQSLRRDSAHARTTLYLGVAYLKLDSLRRATTYLQRTVDQEARGPLTNALEQLGTTHSQRGRVASAVRTYKTALRLRPSRAALYFHLATVYDEHYRDKRPAARYYRRFLRAAESPVPELRSYAESRLETLRPTLHMQRAEESRGRAGEERERPSDGG
jgi:tetratricopeptide (TPR) repeat protein